MFCAVSSDRLRLQPTQTQDSNFVRPAPEFVRTALVSFQISGRHLSQFGLASCFHLFGAFCFKSLSAADLCFVFYSDCCRLPLFRNSTYCPNHRTTPPSGSTSASGEYISLAKDGIKVDLGARRPWKPMFDYRSLNFAHSFVTSATTPSLSSSSPQSSPSSSASDQINPYTASDQIDQTSENSIKLRRR